MTSAIDNLSFSKDVTEEPKLHCLPCKIHFNGDANISDYFKPMKNSEKELTVSFRGYPLNGKVIQIPESYQGFILKSGSQKSLVTEGKFHSMTYWEWDKKPTLNDPFLSALDWLSLSKEVHDPVDEDPDS